MALFISAVRKQSSLKILFSYNADTFLDMISADNLIHHGNGVVCITYDALAAAVQGQLLTGQNVFPCSLSFGLEISLRTDKGLLDIVSFPKFFQCSALCLRQRKEPGREIRSVADHTGVLRIHIQAASTADNHQTDFCTGKDIAQMLEGSAVICCNINDYIKYFLKSMENPCTGPYEISKGTFRNCK